MATERREGLDSFTACSTAAIAVVSVRFALGGHTGSRQRATINFSYEARL